MKTKTNKTKTSTTRDRNGIVKKDSRKKLNIHPFYQERLNKIAEAEQRTQKVTLEILIDLKYEDLVKRNLIHES